MSLIGLAIAGRSEEYHFNKALEVRPLGRRVRRQKGDAGGKGGDASCGRPEPGLGFDACSEPWGVPQPEILQKQTAAPLCADVEHAIMLRVPRCKPGPEIEGKLGDIRLPYREHLRQGGMRRVIGIRRP